MRHVGAIVWGALWLLLLSAYLAPLRLPRFGSLDIWISVDPPGRTCLAHLFVGLVLLVPPLVLAFITWWVHHHPEA